MNKELIDRCLDFAEGKKGKFTILMAKKPSFPESLIEGTDKQREINKYVSEGLPTRKIADIMGCTHVNIVNHLRQYKNGVAFYHEWCEFWEFAERVRQTPVSVAFEGLLTEEEFQGFQRRGIITVEDFITMTVTISITQIYRNLPCFRAESKERLFVRIKEMCYDLL